MRLLYPVFEDCGPVIWTGSIVAVTAVDDDVLACSIPLGYQSAQFSVEAWVFRPLERMVSVTDVAEQKLRKPLIFTSRSVTIN